MIVRTYQPKVLSDIVGQPAVSQLEMFVRQNATLDSASLFVLIESPGVAGCGKTSAARMVAEQLTEGGVVEDWPGASCTAKQFRNRDILYDRAAIWGNQRRGIIIDDIECLSYRGMQALRDAMDIRHFHLFFVATTSVLGWADKIPGMVSRWQRFRFVQPTTNDVLLVLHRVIAGENISVPSGFELEDYLLGKYGVQPDVSNIRDCIHQLDSAIYAYRQCRRQEPIVVAG